MCGIAGIYSQAGDWIKDGARLHQMQRVLAHRGPDDEGVDLLPELGVGLVHTRLSVIDLSSAGHQPMWNDDRSMGIVFNGEIYNFKELRRQLESTGAIFRSHTDTEVILRGYEAWGIDIVNRLNGMFALAVWDSTQRALWLVRDRLGKKPLYYWHDPAKQILLFASEIKALLEWPWIRREVNPSALQCYLALGYVPAPHTMFNGIKKLPAGHWLRYDSRKLEVHGYWNVSAMGNWTASTEEYSHSIRRSVEQAVERRLVSDVPLGAFFSGGVDSSIVVGLMSRMMKEPVRTFSAAFDVGTQSPKYNTDADTADVVSRIFGTHHTRFAVKPNGSLLQDLNKIVWHMDEPHANPTLVSTYMLARLVKEQGITVALSGDGSDEIFGGYYRYRADHYITWARYFPRVFRRAMIEMAKVTTNGKRLAGTLSKADLPPLSPERYMTWYDIFDRTERESVLSHELSESADAPYRCIGALLKDVPTANDQEFLSYLDLAMWLAEESNMRVDKMTMAHALEVRAPFQDYLLVEQAMSIPFKEKAGWLKGKVLLKDTFADLLPEVVLKRPKLGWLSPSYCWTADLLWQDVRRLIRWLPETGLFSDRVFDFVESSLTARTYYKVWTLMMFALWYRRFIADD